MNRKSVKHRVEEVSILILIVVVVTGIVKRRRGGGIPDVICAVEDGYLQRLITITITIATATAITSRNGEDISQYFYHLLIPPRNRESDIVIGRYGGVVKVWNI